MLIDANVYYMNGLFTLSLSRHKIGILKGEFSVSRNQTEQCFLLYSFLNWKHTVTWTLHFQIDNNSENYKYLIFDFLQIYSFTYTQFTSQKRKQMRKWLESNSFRQDNFEVIIKMDTSKYGKQLIQMMRN